MQIRANLASTLQLLQTVCGQKVFENFPINVRVCLEEK